LQDLTLRDTRDSKRRAAPLAVAPDAKVIDTTVPDVAVAAYDQAAVSSKPTSKIGRDFIRLPLMLI